MLPLTLLQATTSHPLLVELKSGETLNGHLSTADTWMNLVLTSVVLTSADGETFTKLKEAYVRGNNIKYLRLPEEVLEALKEKERSQRESGGHGHHGHGGHVGRGGQRGGGGAGGGRGGRGDADRGRGRGRGGRGGGGGAGGQQRGGPGRS